MEKESIAPSNKAPHLTRKNIGLISLRLSRIRLPVRRAGDHRVSPDICNGLKVCDNVGRRK